MNRNNKETLWIYRIDKDDNITEVNDNFLTFANRNGWLAGNITGQSIFDFIEGLEISHLYRLLFTKVRRGNNLGPIPYRCDSPQERRFLEMFLYCEPDEKIQIVSRLIKVEPRNEVKTLCGNLDCCDRSDKIIVMRSMCKKISIPDKRWVEIEEGLRLLHIFEKEEVPQISHGLCPECMQTLLNELK